MYQVHQACYPTAAAAAQVSASAQIGSVVQHGASAYIVNVSAVDDVSITYALAPVTGGAALVVVSSYSAQPCNLLTMQDGLQLGWLVGAAWIAAFALLFITRAFRGETNENYGNS